MRGIVMLLALLSAPLWVQDEARIKELIEKLDDDSFEVREKAEKELVAIGAAAVPSLRTAAAEAERQKDQTEVKVRALSALRAIEFTAKAKQFYYEPKLVTLRLADSELARVLSELEKQTGVKFDASPIDTKAKVSIDALHAPLFKVLDDLCRGQEARSYDYREEGVKFQKSRHVPCPAAYEGPFRIRVVKLKQERATDFKTSQAQVQLSLEADWQKYLKPSRRVDLEIRKATDDKGGTLEIQKAEDADDGNGGVVMAGAGRFLMRRGGNVVRAVGEEETAQAFTLKGVSDGATRVSIQGIARFHFPLEKTDIVFEKPGAGEPQQTGDVTITLKNVNSGRFWRVTFSRSPGRPTSSSEDIDSRVDTESLTAIDENGKEHKGALNLATPSEGVALLRPGAEVPDGMPLASFQAVFPTLQNKAPKEIRFKFVSQVFVKSVPFSINDFALP